MDWIWEVLVVFLLVIANGVFAASEMAIVTARTARLESREPRGSRGARAALRLIEHRDRFLAAVQVGITLLGTLASAYSGARIAEPIAAGIRTVPALAPYAGALGLTVVVLALTYVSLVVGELVPKRLALARAEETAVRLAPSMEWFAALIAPAVALLTATANPIVRLFRGDRAKVEKLTVEEFGHIVTEGLRTGLLQDTGAEVVESVVRMTDRTVHDIMTPRTELAAIRADASVPEVVRSLQASTYSRFPVYDGDLDHIVGVLHARDLLLAPADATVARLMRPALRVPETVRVLDALRLFQRKREHAAVVLDEYGGTAGWVTLEDILEEVVGEIPSEHGEEQTEVVARADGSLLVDGRLPLHQLFERLEIDEDKIDAGDASTVAGWVLHALGEIPRAGQVADIGEFRLEVVDLDRNRIDKLLVTRRTSPRGEEAATGPTDGSGGAPAR
jgi:putative hemolysin